MFRKAYIYLGGNSLHVGQYINLINILERKGLIVDLIVGRFISLRHPLRAWGERKKVGTESIRQAKGRIQGELHAFFYTRFKTVCFFTILRHMLISLLRW